MQGGSLELRRSAWSRDAASPPGHNQPSTVHVLGPVLDTRLGRLTRSLSDDVFDRLIQSLAGCSFKVTVLQRLGEALWGPRSVACLTRQGNTYWSLSGDYLCDVPPEFPLQAFRLQTDHWDEGLLIPHENFDRGPANTSGMFRKATIMGMPRLPDGLGWAAHYVDERTGTVMRALMDYEINTDGYTLRYDVICGW